VLEKEAPDKADVMIQQLAKAIEQAADLGMGMWW
jgi:hypothetical protein